MARANESEREALRQAAEAVAPLLKKLRLERTDLDERIATMEAVVTAYEAACGKRPRRASVQEPLLPSNNHERVKRGQVTEHVDAVLRSGGDYDEPELRKQIRLRFNTAYGRPSIYSALRRGLKTEKYEQKEGKWRIKF